MFAFSFFRLLDRPRRPNRAPRRPKTAPPGICGFPPRAFARRGHEAQEGLASSLRCFKAAPRAADTAASPSCYRPPSAHSSLLFLSRPPAPLLASKTRPAHGRISRAFLYNELGLGGCCAALHALRILAGSRRGPGLAPLTYWCCGAGHYNDPDCNTRSGRSFPLCAQPAKLELVTGP